MVPCAAFEANASPCSRARKKTIGADVRGRAINHPLIVGPHRRPAKLTDAISKGTRISFNHKDSAAMPKVDFLMKVVFAVNLVDHQPSLSQFWFGSDYWS